MPEPANDDTPLWNPETGTFADPAQSAPLDAQALAERISQGLTEADVATYEQPAVIDILGNAAVYLHGADAFNRPATTIGAIADEWSSLGVSAQEADFSAVNEHAAGYEAPDRDGDQGLGALAVGGFDVDGKYHSDRDDDMEL
jgi:hypothetical protein